MRSHGDTVHERLAEIDDLTTIKITYIERSAPFETIVLTVVSCLWTTQTTTLEMGLSRRRQRSSLEK